MNGRAPDTGKADRRRIPEGDRPDAGRLVVGSRLAHYVIVARLGAGGMGEVYLAEDTKLERRVALKVLPARLARNPSSFERFEREAKILAALDHPSITTIYSVEESGGVHFFTMEYVEGTRLDQMLESAPLKLDRFLAIAIPLVDALSAAHERGIVHRDLKPANVLVTPPGKVKVLDFGLSKLRRELPRPGRSPVAGGTETQVGVAVGTVPYMSPEQLRGEPADPRSDLFSLGITLWEMVTGSRPFEAETPSGVISSILLDDPAQLLDADVELPPRLLRLLRRCLERDSERRWPCARDVGDELRAIAAEGSVPEQRIRSIAVLPFAGDPSESYLGEGMAEELIHALTKIQDLRVASRGSSFLSWGGCSNVREVGLQLGVDTVLEGSIRREDDRLRVTVELVDVEDGCVLWASRYDRRARDIFAIQAEIAHSIVEAMQLALSPAERRAMQVKPPEVVGAYDYYLKGRQFFYQYSARGIKFARQLFQRAIELDPRFARAYCGIADYEAFLYENREHSPEHVEKALETSGQALALDSTLPDAHVSRAVALSLAGRDDEATDEFETAVRVDPRHFEAHYIYARHCFTRGRFDEAIRHYERASELRPDDYQPPLLMAQVYDDLGRSAEAAESRRLGVTRVEHRCRLSPDDARALYMGANGLVALGETDRGLRWARRARELDPEEPMLLYNLACIFSLAGRADDAIDCVEDAVRNGFANLHWIDHDSNLDAVREDSRFRALSARLADDR